MADTESLQMAYQVVTSGVTGHLTEDRWERLAMDEMNAAERETALDHVLSCEECARVYRGVLGVRMAAHAFDDGAPTPKAQERRPPTRRWGLPVVLVASAAVVVTFFVGRPFLQTPAVSNHPESVTLRAGEEDAGPVLVAPLGMVMADGVDFSWKPVPGARGYIVELFDGDGETLWTSGKVATTSIGWPADVEVVRGRYYWRVMVVSEGLEDAVPSLLEAFDVGISASHP
ncbi:MAG: hypothetical protein ACC742_10300 [Thermoanaerobaculales bacterium]